MATGGKVEKNFFVVSSSNRKQGKQSEGLLAGSTQRGFL
jgi:hypothetical protein